ncbi:MAG: hypothetical protein EA409_07740 [Saprospirales bacterium]|nr:MAG: hypothetical protein EA409_07740 [Saprospirales bacterium]
MKSTVSVCFTLALSLMISTNYAQNSDFLIDLLEQNVERLGEPAIDSRKHRVQIIYTQIERDKENQPHFSHHRFNAWEGRYFYPASVVKMPTALIALELINKVGIEGLNEHTTFLTGAGSEPQTAVKYDLSAPGKLPTVEHYIKKIFLVSDNDGFNRLYEMLGQKWLNELLWQKGLEDTRIIHRLSAPEFDHQANRRVNPVYFISNGQLLYYRSESNNWIEPILHNMNLRNLRQGSGYIWGGELIEEPFDFSTRNYSSLEDLHQCLKTLLFPESQEVFKRFYLKPEQYELIYKAMSMYPRESIYPAYDSTIYHDSFVKYLKYGGKQERIPENIRIFNKVGRAYGYLTDVAYIVDFENGVEFLLSATVYTNENDIFNDNQYEYDEIGLPFLAELGKLIYEYELERDRSITPDLNSFKFDYSKDNQ